MENVNKIKPSGLFTNYIFKTIPLAFDESMSYYETLCGLLNYLRDTVIPAVDNNADAIIEVQNLMQQLQDYVDHYFDNLDIQEEVNTKLDEMAESGELAELISQYLESQAVIGFNTCSSLAGATNLANGSFARTYGRNNYKDGYGAFYKIRTRTNADDPDGYNLIALTETENLVAERIVESFETDINNIEEEIENLNTKKYGFMGDSYGDGYTPDGTVTSWISLLATKLDLESGDYVSSHHGGDGFSSARPDYNYINQLSSLTSDEDMTDFYVCGGYNDQGQTEANIISGIASFKTAFDLKYPNAKLHIGMIGWTSNGDKLVKLKNVYIAYKKACEQYNIDLLDGCEFALHNYYSYFSSDGIHPNLNGQTSIANALYKCIKYGRANIVESSQIYFSGSNLGTANITLECVLNNGIVSVSDDNSSTGALTFTNAISITGNNFVEIADITNGLIAGTDKNDVMFRLPAVVFNGSTYSHEVIQLLIRDKKLYIGCPHASGGNYTSINVKAVQLMGLNGSFSAFIC